MDDGNGSLTQATVTADVGANLVAVLVILLVAVGLVAGAPGAERPVAIVESQMAVPRSGAGQSDLLYRRLHADADGLVVELTEAGAFVPVAGGMMPLDAVRQPWPNEVTVFVFSPRHHAAFRQEAIRQGARVEEVTVPDALRRAAQVAGHSAFGEAFLAIRVGEDPASIRPPLLRLLQSGAAGGGMEAAVSPDKAAAASTVGRWVAAFQAGVNILCLGLATLGLWLLRRRIAGSEP